MLHIRAHPQPLSLEVKTSDVKTLDGETQDENALRIPSHRA